MSGYVADSETVWTDDPVPRMPVFCADYEVEVEQKLNQLALTTRLPPVDQDNYVTRPTFSWILRRSDQGCDAAVGRHVCRDAGGIVAPCSCGQLKRNSSPAVPCCDQRRLDTVPEFRVPPTGWRCCPHGHGHMSKMKRCSLTPPRSLSQSSVRDDVGIRSLQQPQVLYDTPNPHAVPVPSSAGVLPLMPDPTPRPEMTKKIQGGQPQRHRRQHRYRRSFSTGDPHPTQPCCYSLERRPRNAPPTSSSTGASTTSRLQPWMLRSQSFSDVRCRSSTGASTAASSARPPLPCSGTSTSTSALYSTADGPFAAHSRHNGSLRRSMRALSGSWRNLVKQVGGMNNRSASSGGGKSAQVRRVAPPTVPEPTVNCCNGSTAVNRHSGGSYSSGCGSHGAPDGVESAPQLSQFQQRPLSTNSAHDGASNAGRCSNLPAQHSHHSTAFPFSQTQVTGSPSPAGSSGSGKEFVPHFHNHIYQHCEDLGIDVQSPGRDSPCSVTTCRHSTSSLDSGRASSSCTAAAVNPTVHPSTLHSGPPSDTPAAVRLSGQSFDSANSAGFRQSYHSSNSSLGSTGRDDVISQLNVAQMLADGLPDLEVLTCWLTDLRLQQYYHLFVEAGYDVATISRMTPEDLTAIGVTRPAHRRKLTAEIARMNIDDRIPDFIPHSLEEWLQLLQLQQYSQLLRAQGYTCVHEVTAITWEDLEEIGISRLGHQKKITLAIKRAKDILTGRRVPSIYQHQYTTQEITIAAPCTPTRDGGATTTAASEFRTFHQPTAARLCRSSPAHRLVAPPPSEPLPHTHLQGSDSPPPPPAPQTHLQYTQQRQMLQQDGWLLQHCSGDSAGGDVTPTNEPMTQSGVTSQQKTANRPVAKIPASARATSVTSDTYNVHCEKLLAQQRLFPPAPSPLRIDSSGSEMSSDGEQAPPSPLHICRAAHADAIIPPAKLTSGDVESAECAFPFANDNAGTIRQRQQTTSTPSVTAASDVTSLTDTSTGCVVAAAGSSDVLGDIGSMLADLTDELDAMLQLERCTATAQ